MYDSYDQFINEREHQFEIADKLQDSPMPGNEEYWEEETAKELSRKQDICDCSDCNHDDNYNESLEFEL